MSLDATHIRFALDHKEHLGAKDISEYLSGTVYPDSRYVSGIKREQTHSAVLEKKLQHSSDDFERGWFIHLLCDKVFNIARTQKYLRVFDGVSKESNIIEWWHRSSALKLVQDLHNVRFVDTEMFSTWLVSKKNPCNEPANSIEIHQKSIADMYANVSYTQITPENYRYLFAVRNIDELSIKTIIDYSQEFLKDTYIAGSQEELYAHAIKLAQEYL
ncbi:hypothetical protein H6758_00275 [Candidatus Nomurabacteria bacterium]|nr:hypothetical protein [Candidatus Nomurabacteria bacterium]